MTRNACILVLWSIALTSCGHSPAPSLSATDSVAIAQTSVSDQKAVGFCWAYASMALIESRHKMRTGEELKLSPEALGFYRMAAGLYELTRLKDPKKILDQLQHDSLEGYFVQSPTDHGQYADAMSLLDLYGVVPESAWSYKFDSAAQVKVVTTAVKAGLVRMVLAKALQGKDASSLTVDDIVTKAMTIPGAFPSAPPKIVVFNGTAMTAVDFMRKGLGFEPNDYADLVAERSTDFATLIAGIKRSLRRGVDPIIGFPVVFKRELGDEFGGDQSVPYAADGWHAVVVTDFVNKGGRAGALDAGELETESAKGADQLDYLLVKNSWGLNADSPSGYYKLDRRYLEEALTAYPDEGALDVVVPKDIAADPFGAEPINPQVVK